MAFVEWLTESQRFLKGLRCFRKAMSLMSTKQCTFTKLGFILTFQETDNIGCPSRVLYHEDTLNVPVSTTYVGTYENTTLFRIIQIP